MAFTYGKTSSNAIAVASLLAERWVAGARTSSLDAAKIRMISRPLAAKLMVQMSQAGIVVGTPGPHGGYSLARHPSEIHLSEIVNLFQKSDTEDRCPYGPGWCGRQEPCALHNQLADIDGAFMNLMQNTTLAVFIKGTVKPAAKAASKASVKAEAKPARAKKTRSPAQA